MYKILFLAANLSSGGAERQLVTLAKLLKRHGLHVEVLCYSRGDFYSSLLKEDAIPIHWKIFNNYFLRIIGIRRFIRREKYDCVISFLEVANFLNNFSAIGGKNWKVITGERSSKKRTFYSKRGKVFGWFQRYADYIVCNSDNSKEMWINNYPQYKNKLITIYNTVQLPQINSKYIPKRDGKVNIIIAASYQYLKNPIGVVEAVSLLDRKKRGNVRIEWYGNKNVAKRDIEIYDEALNLIKENNLENIIYLNDPVTDIAEKMNQGDFVGLFSELEGLPNAVCEGMMMGKPIIMTKVSDYNRLVDETNGFLCDWNNPISIKDAFQKAINLSNEAIIEMGNNSREKALNLFSNERIIKLWLRLINLHK